MRGTPGERVASDPFDLAVRPDAYAPFAASERALRELEETLGAGRVAALIGPPGLGKSLLLHRLAVQQRQLHALYVPFCTLTLAELSSFALGLLDWPGGPDPVVALAQHARALGTRGSGVLLLIDDAGAMPLETAVGLEGLLKLAVGTLRIALAAADSEEAQRVCAAFAPDLDEIRLEQGMSQEEAHRYVQMRLDTAQADAALRSAFGTEAVDALFRESEGVPRRLNLAAQEIVRRVRGEALPRLRDSVAATPAQDAATAPTQATRAQVAALLANEPDVREVVASLHDKAAPPAAQPQPTSEPQPAQPTAATGSAPAPTAGEPRESKVGTYRMVRSAGGEAVADATPKTAAAPPRTRAGDAVAALQSSPEEDSAASVTATGEAPQQEIADSSPLQEEASHETLFVSPEVEREFREAARAEPMVPRPGGAPAAADERRAPTASAAAEAHEREEVGVEDVAMPPEKSRPVPRASRSLSATNALWNTAAAGAGVLVGVAFLWAWIHFEPVSPGDEAAEPARIETAEEPTPPEPARAAREREPSSAARIAAPTPSPSQRSVPIAPEPAPTATAPAQAPSAAIAPPAIVRVGINAVPWAVIEVDGIELGETPLAGIGIPAGPHTFRARMPDGSVREQTVEIDAINRHVVFD